MFKLVAALDHTLASLNDPILAALVVPHPEAFVRLLWVSLAVTAGVVPWLAYRERRLRDALGAGRSNPAQAAA
jgi:hypothetical protein